MSDVGNSQDVNKKKTKRQAKRDQELDDLRHLLEMPGGRNFIWRLLTECGVYHTSFVSDSTSETAYNEGKRQMGLWTLEEMFSASPHIYALMQKENRKPNE